MRLSQEIHHMNLQSAELLKYQAVVLEFFGPHDVFQLPGHHRGRDSLLFGQRGSVEFAQLRQPLASQCHARLAVLFGDRSQLPVQIVLLGIVEILGRGRQHGVTMDPLGSEGIHPGAKRQFRSGTDIQKLCQEQEPVTGCQPRMVPRPHAAPECREGPSKRLVHDGR
jgi:hypothetical protein